MNLALLIALIRNPNGSRLGGKSMKLCSPYIPIWRGVLCSQPYDPPCMETHTSLVWTHQEIYVERTNYKQVYLHLYQASEMKTMNQVDKQEGCTGEHIQVMSEQH